MIKTFFIGSLATAAICSAADKKPSPILTDDGKCVIAPSTTTDHRAIVLYLKGEDGYLNEETMVGCNTDSLVLSPDEISAFDTKNKTLYYSTDRGVYAATIKKDLAKKVQGIKGLNKLSKEKDIESLTNELCQELKARINEENNRHLSKLKQQQAIQDSILRLQRHALDVEEYRNKRLFSWRYRKMASDHKCDVCNDTHHEGDSVYIVKTTPSYWFYKLKSPGSKEWSSTTHSMKAPRQNENNAPFFEAFADSLKAKKNELPYLTIDAARKKNELITSEAFRKSVPWGFVYNWGWDINKGNIIFEVTFLNASDLKIKEIYFYTNVTGPGNKPITSCLFKANTPVPPGEYGYWRWDPSKYNVDDSASNMSFSKIVIVYADGSKKTLQGKELKVFRK